MKYLLVAAAAFGAVASAHHSFSAEFDSNQPVKMSGVVTEVRWGNPHIWFFLDVKDEATGKVTNWGFSGGSPNQLMRRGVTKKAIQEGMTIMVEGFRAKDGSNNANGARITYPDGRNVLTAGGEDRIPGEGKGAAKGEGQSK